MRISIHTLPSPRAIPWSQEDEAQVTSLLRHCLRGAPGSWRVALTFSGVLANTWVVECQRVEDEHRLRMLLDVHRPDDWVAFQDALASLGAVAERPARRRRARTPAVSSGRVSSRPRIRR